MSFSYDGPNAVLERPPHVDPASPGNWARDVSAPGAGNGTVITASLLNMIVGNLRKLCVVQGVPLVEGSDDLLAAAVAAVLANPAFTGIPTAPTADIATNTEQIATTAFVYLVTGALAGLFEGDLEQVQIDLDEKAPITNPVFQGVVTLANDPATPLEAATKRYVDAAALGMAIKLGVNATSTGNVSVTAAPATLDGVAASAGHRWLLKNQTAPAENGIWVFASAGAALTRATDMDSWAELVGALVGTHAGTTNVGSVWMCTVPASGTLGTTAITWSPFSMLGGLLAAISVLVPSADQTMYFTGPINPALTPLTLYARTLLAAADAAAARTVLGAGADGLTGINTQLGSYTLVAADKGKTIEINSPTAANVTVPPALFADGSYVNVVQVGAGQVTLVAGAGVTLASHVGPKTAGQWAMATLYKRAAPASETWVIGGDVTA